MKTATKTFKDGELIYARGDESRWAFELLEGSVEIIGDGDEGPTVLARLKTGEMFGEMGVLDSSPRTNSARARGLVTVKAIGKDEFLKRVESDPTTALKVMTKLAKRMRSNEGSMIPADVWRETTAKLPIPLDTGVNVTPTPRLGRAIPPNLIGERKSNFFERILDTVVKDKTRRPGKKAKAPTPGDIQILVCLLRDDYENTQRKLLAEALSGIPGVRVELIEREFSRFVPGVLEANALNNDDTVKRINREGRAWLAERNADLLIWGQMEPTGRNVELHFVTVASSPGERPGRFTSLNTLYLPVDFYSEWQPMIRACVLAAIDPRSFAQGRILRAVLPSVAQSGRAMGMDPSAAMESHERAAILFCYGNAAAMCAQLEGDRSWYQTAADAWRMAIDLYGNIEGAVVGQLYQQMGLVLQIIAERTNDTDTLENAADAYRRALVHISRRKQPADWGLMKYRLGCVLYKIDMAAGDDNALREAIHACQSARQVFNRYTHPIRWSEISNTLSQILQVYGDNARSVPVLEYAVKCCAAALQVRTPDTAPLQWAAIQNTLGSALFLLAKHTGEWEYMRQSSDAFRYALMVYKDHGAGKMAIVTERNLHRAEKQIQTTAEKHVVEPVWAQSFMSDSDFDDTLSPFIGDFDSSEGITRVA